MVNPTNPVIPTVFGYLTINLLTDAESVKNIYFVMVAVRCLILTDVERDKSVKWKKKLFVKQGKGI